MDRVQKVLKRALARENILKLQFKINKSEKKDFFILKIRNVASDVWMLSKPRLGPDPSTGVNL